MTVGTWNINGWTNNNHIIRSLIICHLNYDIFCLCETHLKDNQSITVENYRAYVHNRSNVHTRAKKGSGGVAILVKNEIMNVCNVTVIDREVDGILGLLFSRKQGSGSFIIFSCYFHLKNHHGLMLQTFIPT